MHQLRDITIDENGKVKGQFAVGGGAIVLSYTGVKPCFNPYTHRWEEAACYAIDKLGRGGQRRKPVIKKVEKVASVARKRVVTYAKEQEPLPDAVDLMALPVEGPPPNAGPQRGRR